MYISTYGMHDACVWVKLTYPQVKQNPVRNVKPDSPATKILQQESKSVSRLQLVPVCNGISSLPPLQDRGLV